jgi:hypothetical protein
MLPKYRGFLRCALMIINILGFQMVNLDHLGHIAATLLNQLKLTGFAIFFAPHLIRSVKTLYLSWQVARQLPKILIF